MANTIVGIGTARSGTKSLAKLLQAQGLDVGHEDTTSVPWDVSRKPGRYGRIKRDLEGCDGDVACWLTQAAGRLLRDTDCRVLTMMRPKADTVDSLLAHFEGLRIREDRPFGPMVFPTYTECSLQQAWETYWHDYRDEVRGLQERYPARVLPVPIESIETREGQERIARFLGIQHWDYVRDCHHNKRDDHD